MHHRPEPSRLQLVLRNLEFVSDNLSHRLCSIFRKNENGDRPFNGGNDMLNYNEHFKDYIMFNEYFNGDTGMGIGASHQTGWTATFAKLIKPRIS